MAPPVTLQKTPPLKPTPPLSDNVPELGREAQRVAKLEAVTEQAKTERSAAGRELAAAKTPAAQKKVDAAQKKLETAYDASTKARAHLDASLRALAPGKGAERIEGLQRWSKAAEAGRDRFAAQVKSLTEQKARAKTPNERTVIDRKLQKATVSLKEYEAGLAAVQQHLAGRQLAAGGNVVSDDLVDLASKSKDAQRKLLGAPITNVSPDQAAAYDAKKISQSMQQSPASGAQMLAHQLADSDEAQQLKLVRAVKADIGRMGAAANGYEGERATEALMEAAKHAKGQARAELMNLVAASVKPPHPAHPLMTTMKSQLKNGDGFEFMNELSAAYVRAKDPASAELVNMVQAGGLRELRNEFLQTKAAVDTHNGEFARITAGFGEAFDPKVLEAYRKKFMAKHEGAYARFDGASARVLKALESTSGIPADVKGPLSVELKLTEPHVKSALESPKGQELLAKAIKDQAEGKESWLDSLNTAKGYLGQAAGAAEVVSRTAVTVLAGGPKGLDAVAGFIKRNGVALGVRSPDEFADLVKRFNSGGLSDAEKRKAIDSVAHGDWGPAQKVVGTLLAAPGVVDGLINFDKQGADGKVKTVIDTAKYAVDTLQLGNDFVKIVSSPKVLAGMGAASKALGLAGIPLELIGGIKDLAEGNTVNGSAGIASAVGSGLMLVPGGQLPGAIIIAASQVVRAVWGENPAKDAEKAQEAEVKAFLKFAGVPEKHAEELSDVLQDGHRNMGTFLPQAAKRMGISTPELMKFLVQNKTPNEVRQFINMVKEMPVDGKWTYKEGSHNPEPGAGSRAPDSADRTQPEGRDELSSPKTMRTAMRWMIKHGFVPEGVDPKSIDVTTHR